MIQILNNSTWFNIVSHGQYLSRQTIIFLMHLAMMVLAAIGYSSHSMTNNLFVTFLRQISIASQSIKHIVDQK